MPRAAEVLAFHPDAERLPEKLTDAFITTACPVCEASQRLLDSRFDDTNPDVCVYRCVKGCGPVLIVEAPDARRKQSGRGFALNGWLVRNPSELYLLTTSMMKPVRLKAHADALASD